jgi:uncharacterized membrane protein YcaP (DUF421 family)
MFLASFADIGRVLIVGTLAYLSLVLLLRISGKRTLTKLNAFDLVVTVALGSTLATVLLNKSVALVEGIVALALLIGLQYGATWLSVRSDRVLALIKSEPTLIARRGRLLAGAMKEQRINREEVFAALRAEGVRDLAELEAVILETDGSISVLKGGDGSPLTLETVSTPPDGRADRT